MTAARPAADTRIPRDDLRVIALLLGCAFVVILNETTMGVAMPAIMTDFDIAASLGQWLTTAFMLTMAVVIPATGYLLQRLGTRGAYLLAMSLFSAGTLLAALAPGFGWLLAARVVQASGTAVMMPLLMTTVMTLVPPTSRGRVMGNISLVMSAAPAMGPALSGAIVDVAGWRWVFATVLPISLVALGAGVRWVHDTAERSTAPLDLPSLLLAVGAFGGLVYGLSAIGEAARGAAPVPVGVPLVAGAALLGLFIWRQLALARPQAAPADAAGGAVSAARPGSPSFGTSESPTDRTDPGDSGRALLDLGIFRIRQFTVALGVMATSMVAFFGAIILLPLFLQDGLGLEPLASGLLVLPGALLMGLLGPTVGRWYDRVGPRPLVLPGIAAVAVGLGALTQVSTATPPWYVLTAHVVMSLGLALVFTPLFTASLGALPPRLYSHGSAGIGTVQQLAGAAGTAMFIAVMTVGSVAAEANGTPPAAALSVGVASAFAWGTAVMAVAFGLALLLRRPPADEPRDEDGDTSEGRTAQEAGAPASGTV